jgi:hypothetical protein
MLTNAVLREKENIKTLLPAAEKNCGNPFSEGADWKQKGGLIANMEICTMLPTSKWEKADAMC